MLHFGATPFDTLKGVTITFLGIALYFYGSYLKNQFLMKQKKESAIFYFTDEVLPLLEYDLETKSMVSQS
jgi:hypothetical protein